MPDAHREWGVPDVTTRPGQDGAGPSAERGPAGAGLLCEAGSVLSRMRDETGAPNLRMRLLALVVALLLAGPLTVALLRGAAAAVRLAV